MILPKRPRIRLQLFTATVFTIDPTEFPVGFSYYGHPRRIRTYSYPFEEWVRNFYFYAPNRKEAERQLLQVGLNHMALNDGIRSRPCRSIREEFQSQT